MENSNALLQEKKVAQLLEGPVPRLPSSYFLKYRIIAPQFALDVDKRIKSQRKLIIIKHEFLKFTRMF